MSSAIFRLPRGNVNAPGCGPSTNRQCCAQAKSCVNIP